MKKGLFIAAFLALSVVCFSQARQTVGTLYRLLPQNDTAFTTDWRAHQSILPTIRNFKSGAGFARQKYRYSFHQFDLQANPDAAYQFDTTSHYRAAAGFILQTSHGAKWYTRTAASLGWSTREGVNMTHPAFTPLHDRSSFIYTDIRTRIAYTPNKFFHASAGIDNQFFGEGYRSLFQGNQVAPNPFALMRVGFWRMEYGLLYQFFHDNDSTRRNWKFGATHYLSYNITKKWNIGFFETVLFQPKDGSFNRAFEVEYLNPIVFFRPQEYSLGSSDNVLMGFQTSVKLKRHTFYAQFLLDEFLLKEIKAHSRWWANKFGVLAGAKGYIKDWRYRIEGSFMRPYTYAHINDGQNGGNQGLPVAHPLGSNFAELLFQLEHDAGKYFRIQAYGAFQLKGYDADSLSWGGDIYQSYLFRPKEYDNTIGQGNTVRTIRVGCEVECLFIRNPRNNSRIVFYLDPQIIHTWGDAGTKTIPMVSIGLRNPLFLERKMF